MEKLSKKEKIPSLTLMIIGVVGIISLLILSFSGKVTTLSEKTSNEKGRIYIELNSIECDGDTGKISFVLKLFGRNEETRGIELTLRDSFGNTFRVEDNNKIIYPGVNLISFTLSNNGITPKGEIEYIFVKTIDPELSAEYIKSSDKFIGTCHYKAYTQTRERPKDVWDAIELLNKDPRIVEEWEETARRADCPVSKLKVSNSAIFAGRINFEKKLLECHLLNDFWDYLKAGRIEYEGYKEPGIYISTFPVTYSQYEFLKKLSQCEKYEEEIISTFEKALLQYESVEDIAPLEEGCSSCKDGYVIFIGCKGENGFSGIGFVFVDRETGRIYW